MRVWQLAAIAVATMTTHVVPASAEVQAPAGQGGASEGGAFAFTALSGPQPYDQLDLRAEVKPVSIEPKPKLRRIASMVDLLSDEDLGLHLSAGVRKMFRRGFGTFNPFAATRATSLIYSPAMAGLLPLRAPVRRNAPAVAVGWMRNISAHALIGFDAGTTFDRGIDQAVAALGNRRWSRIDPVAQASFALRF
ncbi:hypothetical protein [Sphingomonas nostoxanthinifaciens]|uniref:hypothetical protein n=1 Tax=Sphingomonas nostoxanthinifaciens TaxID=2872652 RepID=UPI001CC1E974|nr:hypothetical protein [Sphingomonas nostoxanthinifaciens]UAK24964.1 hypothetical protein K8P63_01755 [Sphingomonas nostoxanthinifaciens]